MRRGAVKIRPVKIIAALILGGALAPSLSAANVALAQDKPPQSTLPETTQPQNSTPQSQQDDPTTAMIGAWEFSNADRDKVCHFNFRSETVSGGYKLDIDKNCPSLFPSTKAIAAWAIDKYGNLRLLNATGSAVIELSEVESGMYDGFQPDEGRYILQAAAAVPVRSADEMVGTWAIARITGKPICTLTLADNAASADLTLKINPGCDAVVTRFGPTTWHMDNGELVLLSPRGQSWRFEENDPNTWQRVPETPDSFLLMRQ